MVVTAITNVCVNDNNYTIKPMFILTCVTSSSSVMASVHRVSNPEPAIVNRLMTASGKYPFVWNIVTGKYTETRIQNVQENIDKTGDATSLPWLLT